MLSDAAGAVFMSGKKNKKGKSLRVDWIEHVSYAGQMEVCMYAGGVKKEDGKVIGWRQLDSLEEALANNYFALKQDTEILINMLCGSPLIWGFRARGKKKN